MKNRPLESFFTKSNPKPKNLFKVSTTACWRGYIGIYCIKNNKLYLDKLLKGDINSAIIPLPQINTDWKSPQLCYWFSGELFIKRGKTKGYREMNPYDTIFEYQLYIEIKNGNVLGVYKSSKNKDGKVLKE